MLQALDVPTLDRRELPTLRYPCAIAAGLDERGIKTTQGCQWSAPQVMRLLQASPFAVAAAAA
jgi:hypothetical protein